MVVKNDLSQKFLNLEGIAESRIKTESGIREKLFRPNQEHARLHKNARG